MMRPWPRGHDRSESLLQLRGEIRKGLRLHCDRIEDLAYTSPIGSNIARTGPFCRTCRFCLHKRCLHKRCLHKRCWHCATFGIGGEHVGSPFGPTSCSSTVPTDPRSLVLYPDWSSEFRPGCSLKLFGSGCWPSNPRCQLRWAVLLWTVRLPILRCILWSSQLRR
jgi:hypothetical protein